MEDLVDRAERLCAEGKIEDARALLERASGMAGVRARALSDLGVPLDGDRVDRPERPALERGECSGGTRIPVDAPARFAERVEQAQPGAGAGRLVEGQRGDVKRLRARLPTGRGNAYSVGSWGG